MKIEDIINDLMEEALNLFSKFRDGDIENFEYPTELEKIREKAITRIQNKIIIGEQRQRLELLEKHVKDFRDILCEAMKNRKFGTIGKCPDDHYIYHMDKEKKNGIVMYWCRYCGKWIKEEDIKKDEK